MPEKAAPPTTHVPPPTMKNRPLPSEPIEQAPLYPPGEVTVIK